MQLSKIVFVARTRTVTAYFILFLEASSLIFVLAILRVTSRAFEDSVMKIYTSLLLVGTLATHSCRRRC